MSKIITEEQLKEVLDAIEEIKSILDLNNDPEEEQPKATSKKKRS